MTTLELSEALDVSLSTIRRDLHLLEEKMISFASLAIVSLITKINRTQSNPVRFASNKPSLKKPANTYMIMTQSSSILAPPRLKPWTIYILST